MIFKVFLTLILGISFTFASSYWNSSLEKFVEDLTIQDRKIFLNTLNSCQHRNTRTFKDFKLSPQESEILLGTFGDINYALNNIFIEGPKQSMKVFVQTGGLGMQLYELLHSPGFMLALKKCFDGDTKKENIYVSELLLIDAIMKGVMMATATLGLVNGLKYLIKKTTIIKEYLKSFYAKPWGKAMFLGLATTPLSSSTPKETERTLIEQTDNQLELLKREIGTLP